MTTPTSSFNEKLAALATMHCRADAPKLASRDLEQHVASLPGWTVAGDRIEKTYRFANYYETVAFVNAVAFIAHREDHHPDLSVHYNRLVVVFSTHSAGGVTMNDIICAAKVERLG